MCELKWDDIYVDASGRQLTYTFIGGKSYAVFAADRSMNSMENLFYGLTRLKKIHNGKIYLNNIDINYIDEDIYLKHIITPIDKIWSCTWSCCFTGIIFCISDPMYSAVHDAGNKLEKSICPLLWRTALGGRKNELERIMDDTFWNL